MAIEGGPKLSHVPRCETSPLSSVTAPPVVKLKEKEKEKVKVGKPNVRTRKMEKAVAKELAKLEEDDEAK